jgi:hypothetical protein
MLVPEPTQEVGEVFYQIMSATMQNATGREASKFLSTVVRHIKKNYPHLSPEMLNCMTGREGRVMFLLRHESMAAAEKAAAAISADKGLQSIASVGMKAEEKRGRSYWIDGFTTDYWQIAEI